MSKDKKPVMMTQAKINKLKQEQLYKAMIYFVAVCMDEFGWREEEIEAFAIRLDRYMKAVEDHTISLKKVSEIIEEVTGMKIYLN